MGATARLVELGIVLPGPFPPHDPLDAVVVHGGRARTSGQLPRDHDGVIAFEDSPNGLRSATAAGLRTVVTPNYWTEDCDFSAASLLLPSLAGLGFEELMARMDRTPSRAT